MTKGVMDNERILCPYPKRAVYIGQNPDDRATWRAENFSCSQ